MIYGSLIFVKKMSLKMPFQDMILNLILQEIGQKAILLDLMEIL